MNGHTLKSMLLLILLAFATLSFATETAPVTVRDLIIVGLNNNLGLQVDKLEVSVANEAAIDEESVFDSEIFASIDYANSVTPIAASLSLTDTSDSESLSGEIGVRKKFSFGLLAALSLNSEWTDDNSLGDDLDPRYRTALNLNLTQPLLRGFGMSANATNLRVSYNIKGQVEIQRQLQAQMLALQIETLASQFVGEKEISDLRVEAVDLAKELYAANKRRFDAGVIPVSEVQEAETALANRELNLSLAQQARDLYFENLNRALNHTLNDKFVSDQLYPFPAKLGLPEIPEFEQLFAAAREKNLSLQLAEIDIQNSDLQHEFSQNQLKPRLDLKLQGGVNRLSGDKRTAVISSSNAGSWSDSVTSAAETDGYQWSAGLEFSLPFGNRSAKSKSRQASLQRKQAHYRHRDQEAELRSSLQQQNINLQRAYEQVKIAERFERLAKLSLHQEQRRLDEGLSDTFRILAFQANMINAQIGRINALIQYYSTNAQINFARGIILEQHNISLPQVAEENSLEIM